MCFLQNRHLNFKIKKEIKGILSNHLIVFLQKIQNDRPVKIPFLSKGSR